MEIRQYLFLLKRWLWLILLASCLSGGAAYVVSRSQQPIYRATSTLLVIKDNNSRDSAYQTQLTSEWLATSYVERIGNFYVLQAALNSLGLTMPPAELRESIFAETVGYTNLLTFSVEHPNPTVAADLANAIPQQFIERTQAQQLERLEKAKGSLVKELAAVEGEIVATELKLRREQNKVNGDDLTAEKANEALLRLRNTQARLAADLEELRLVQANQLETVLIDEFAQPPERPLRPRIATNTLLATMAGFMLTVGVAFLFEYLDDTVKDPEDVELSTGLGTLGVLEVLPKTNISEMLIVAREPRSPAAEAYRRVRTNVQFADVDRRSRTLLVTSAQPNEGKTTVAANLAIALAQSGKRVILVDCDMRRPTLHDLFELPTRHGLTDIIIRGRCDTRYISGTLVPNLRVLSAGRIPPNPAELLGSERMQTVVAWLQTLADYVVFDTPPVLAVTDAVVLAQAVDTTLMVVNATNTRYPVFMEAVERLTAVQTTIAGVVLNKVDPKQGGSYYANYYQIDYRPGVVYQSGWWQRLAKHGFTALFH